MKARIYRLITPDAYQLIMGYRWKIETYKTTVVSKTIFTTRQSAKKSCKNYIEKHNLRIEIDPLMEGTTDFDFLV